MGKTLLKILAALLIMAGAVFTVGQLLRPDHAPGPDEAHSILDKLPRAAAQGGERTSLSPTMRAATGVATRSLSKYYERRAYPGAPPVIPHPVDETINRNQRCNVCHAKGGFTPKFNAYIPLTPHPDFLNCMQCHVQGTSGPLFVTTHWKSIAPPAIGRPALPGSPPPIPHGLALRDNCLACHGGPAAVPEIRCTHPERLSCRQCHAAQDTQVPFARPSESQ